MIVTVVVTCDRYVLAQNIPSKRAGPIFTLLQSSLVVSTANVLVNKFVRACVVDSLARYIHQLRNRRNAYLST